MSININLIPSTPLVNDNYYTNAVTYRNNLFAYTRNLESVSRGEAQFLPLSANTRLTVNTSNPNDMSSHNPTYSNDFFNPVHTKKGVPKLSYKMCSCSNLADGIDKISATYRRDQLPLISRYTNNLWNVDDCNILPSIQTVIKAKY